MENIKQCQDAIADYLFREYIVVNNRFLEKIERKTDARRFLVIESKMSFLSDFRNTMCYHSMFNCTALELMNHDKVAYYFPELIEDNIVLKLVIECDFNEDTIRCTIYDEISRRKIKIYCIDLGMPFGIKLYSQMIEVERLHVELVRNTKVQDILKKGTWGYLKKKSKQCAWIFPFLNYFRNNLK